jgi:hypothetical protein
MRVINRLVYGTVLIAAALAAFAVHHNHVTYPCGAHQVGAAGMCVTTQYGGAA